MINKDFRSLSVIQEPNADTLKAVEELKGGQYAKCTSFEDYLTQVGLLECLEPFLSTQVKKIDMQL